MKRFNKWHLIDPDGVEVKTDSLRRYMRDRYGDDYYSSQLTSGECVSCGCQRGGKRTK